MNKVSIYFVNNLANAGQEALENDASGKARRSMYASRLATVPAVLTKDESLQTDTGLETNDIWLSIDGTNYEDADIHIVGARIDVKKKNNIVSTALVNRSGKVKERIQEDDYTVVIQGNLYTGESGKFPYELLKRLNGILSSADSIYVASRYLDIFDITQLAFKNAAFNQSSLKYFNVLPFTLEFESDMDYNFLIEE